MDRENDIYGLAQQSGILPNPAASPSAPPQFLDPNFGTLTDEDLLAHFVPQQFDGPVTQPSQYNPAESSQFNSPPPTAQTPSKVKVGAEVTTKGFSGAKNQQIARGPGARLDQQIAGIENRGAAEASAASEFPTSVAAEEKQAALGETEAEKNRLIAEGRYKGMQAQIFRNYDLQTEKVIGEEQGKAQVAKASYVAALNDFRSSRVNPAQLWDNMSGGEHVGMLAAAFVQDFLGAKGIHTSAMATFNKAVDRNIDAQVKAIETKGRVADGFKTLYDMQLQESSSKEEARLRMRGFMLDSFKTAVESHMAQYNSALANAKGLTATAKIDQELVKTVNEINKHQDAVTGQRIQQALTRYGDELQASTAYARIKADREIAEANRKAAKGPTDPYADLVFDTTQSGGGKAVGEFIAGVKPEEKEKYHQLQAGTNNGVALLREYQDGLRKYKASVLAGTRFQDTDAAKLKAKLYTYLNSYIKDYGGTAVSKEEAERLKTLTPEELFGTKFNVGAVIGQTQVDLQDKLAVVGNGIIKPLHPADPRRQIINPPIVQGKPEYDEASAVASGEADRVSPEQEHQDDLVKKLEKHSIYEPDENAGARVSADFKRFTKLVPEAVHQGGNAAVLDPAGGIADTEGTPLGYTAGLAKPDRARESADDTPRGYASAFTGLADQAEKAKKDGDEATYGKDVEILRKWAAGDDTAAIYAQMKLHDIGASYESSAKNVTEEPEVPYAITEHGDVIESPKKK